MGPAGLTAVFGMGTGVAPPVWSPENRPAGRQARRPQACGGWSHSRSLQSTPHQDERHLRKEPKRTLGSLASAMDRPDRGPAATGSPSQAVVPRHDGGEPIGVVKLLGC